MRLIIGGAHQGKLRWILQQTGYTESDVAVSLDEARHLPILNSLHQLVRDLLEKGISPQAEIEALLRDHSELIVLCDEIGCGVVPMDAFERSWREETGRICCWLAERAVRVDRVFCGIAICIKREVET